MIRKTISVTKAQETRATREAEVVIRKRGKDRSRDRDIAPVAVEAAEETNEEIEAERSATEVEATKDEIQTEAEKDAGTEAAVKTEIETNTHGVVVEAKRGSKYNISALYLLRM